MPEQSADPFRRSRDTATRKAAARRLIAGGDRSRIPATRNEAFAASRPHRREPRRYAAPESKARGGADEPQQRSRKRNGQPSLRQGITEREAEIAALTANTLSRGKNSVHTQIRDLRKRVVADLGDLRGLLSTRDNATAMHMMLAKHVNEIVLGKWGWLGDGDRRGVCRGRELFPTAADPSSSNPI
jgi:hypothetical protein